MKPKTLFILLIAAAILVVTAVINTRRTSLERNPDILYGRKLFNELDVNKVAKIVVTTAAEETVLAKHDDIWVCENKHNYPANFEKLRSILLALAELKIGETRLETASAQDNRSFNTLRPSEAGEKDADSCGTMVEMLDKDGNLIESFILGKTYDRKSTPKAPDMFQFGGGADGRFIRVGDAIYLVADPLHRLDDTSISWLNTDIVNVPAADILSMRIEDPDGGLLEAARPEPGEDFVIKGLSNKEEVVKSAIDGLARTFSYLSFSDLANPGLPDDITGFDKALTLRATAKDGKIYKLTVGNQVPDKKETYVKLSVETDPEKTENPSDQDKDESDKKSELDNIEKIKTEAIELNERLSKWIYTIPQHRTSNITTDREKFVKQTAEEEENTQDTTDNKQEQEK